MAGAKNIIGATLVLKDNMSVVFRDAKKEQRSFRKEISETRKELDKTFKKKHEAKLDATKAHKTLKKLREGIDPLRKEIVTILAVKDMAKYKIKSTLKSLKEFKPVKITLRVAAFGLNILTSVLKILTGIAAAATGAITALAFKGVKDGLDLEQQMVSMKHFIGVNNKGKSDTEVTKVRDDYIKALRDNANITPFTTQEVVSGGARAINIVGGNTEEAMALMKVAEDMAALNPGKSLSDALEALADMKNMEFERMKEFGFKFSAEEAKKIVGKGKTDDLSDKETMTVYKTLVDKKLQPFFNGGSEKLSGTGIGLISTIKGKLGSKLQDFGLRVVDNLRPKLEKIVDIIDKSAPTLDKIADKASIVVNDVFEWIWNKLEYIYNNREEIVKNLKENAQSAIEKIKEFAQAVIDLANTLGDVANFIKDPFGMENWKNSKNEKAKSWIIEKALKYSIYSANKEEKRKENFGKNGLKKDGSHYNGLDYVPFDGYIAELHKGERVVTAKENKTYGKGNNLYFTINAQDKSVRQIADELVPLIISSINNQ